jgi:shikimate kinase
MSNEQVISLIGFPGSGKSTVGVLLAKRLGTNFVDTDILIQNQAQATLAEIIDQHDHVYLRQLEEQVLLDMPIHPSVISTGGSVIYSPKVMARLAETSIVVFLSARLDTVEYRISLAPDRGIASSKEQTLADIYGERVPLYEHWAKVTIAVDDATPEALVDQLVSHLDTIAR